VIPRFKTTVHSSAPRTTVEGWTARAGENRENVRLDTDRGARAKVYLHPGQLFATAEASAITTILGSCVSVCLWDPALKIGGMNHYLLPFWVGEDMASPRFGTVAIDTLIENVLALGARKDRLRAKLFGGACVIEAFREREEHIGVVNARLAENMLRLRSIPVVEQDVTGCRGRKLLFNTDDGKSLVKYL
jgi:chemotaxis protein CheD